MAQEALKDAIDRVKRNYASPRFLTPDEIRARLHEQGSKDIMCLVRKANEKFYVGTYATLISETPSGKLKVFRYVSGSETCLVDMQAVFICENNWCNNQPVILALISTDHIKGTVYWERKKYVRKYDASLSPEEVKQLAEQDWRQDRSLFTVEG